MFTQLDNYNGEIAYDTETTGLKINMFGKINSKWSRKLAKYNLVHENNKIKADRLVGIIFCVEENVSYYFPCFNRKFKNLYEDKNSVVRNRLIQNIKSKYTIGEFRNLETDMARYWRDTPADDVSSDCLLMERCRNILTTKHLVAHNGSFEWKVSQLYDIDINLKDDTMIMHQIMYKFRSTTSNAGEPSNLKYLTKRELGIDQLDLADFFANYKEDESGLVRGKKKKGLDIDFSYMDYAGTKAYAPADGDTTLTLYHKYKKDLIENHKELIYIYNVEIVVACAIGYMEFYGHRIDEEKIEDVRNKTVRKMINIEHQIRELAGMSNKKEQDEVDILNSLDSKLVALEKLLKEIRDIVDNILTDSEIEYTNEIELNKIIKESVDIRNNIISSLSEEIKDSLSEFNISLDTEESIIQLVLNKLKELSTAAKKQANNCKSVFMSTEDTINLASPAQVADLLFNRLKYPFDGEKISVAKKILKGLMKAKDADGNNKYPVAHLYSEWKKLDTLVTKFFDALPEFMYPGGFIFSSFGQISTATGRMSSKKPNSQQYSKDITKIVVPRDNNIILDADYSQIEYRTLVALANEPKLAELFKDPDNDYHTLMASMMYGVPYASVTPKMRSDAKSFNFGIPYGMGFKSLAILLTGMSGPAQVEEAKEKYQLYFKDQPNVKKFFEDVKEKALVNRYTKTYWNRYRYYSFEDKDGNFSQAKKAMALRQAANALIQGTAADIFKISVARNFLWIRNNGLIGKVFIINMIHDEQLMEIDCNTLNTQAILRDVLRNMEFKVEGFPPLYVGAGFGNNWADAKGKIAEIHPHLAEQLQQEAEGMNLLIKKGNPMKKVLEYYNNRVYQFRLNKVKEYLLNPENYGKEIHPVIGNLVQLQFTYGLEKDYKDNELTIKALEKFIEVNNLDVDINNFTSSVEREQDVEEDVEYTDGEEDELEELEDIYNNEFSLIDESDKLYGVSLQDLIREFSLIASKERKVFGLDINIISYKIKDKLMDYLAQHEVADDTDGAMEIVFLRTNNVLFRTGVYVANIDIKEMVKELGLKSILYK